MKDVTFQILTGSLDSLGNYQNLHSPVIKEEKAILVIKTPVFALGRYICLFSRISH
jgi:hypothetical protein